MRATWHILAQMICLALGCGSSRDDAAAGAVQRECPTIPLGLPGSTGTYERVPTDVTVRETYKGTNGEFTDRCQGESLVQYSCQVSWIEGPPDDPGTWVSASGAVEPTILDCGGHCLNGACPNVCPAVSEELRYVTIDTAGKASFESLGTGISYTCFLRGAAAGVDCTTTPKPGDVVNVIATPGGICLTTAEFWTGTGTAPECDYWWCTAVLP
jgi:hypothetical protein